MVQVHIFYSLRKTKENLPELKLFADEDCARLDQEIFKFWDSPCYGSFLLEVSGVAYVDAVTTREDYMKELEDSDVLHQKITSKLQR